MEQRKKGLQMTDDFHPWKLQFLKIPCEFSWVHPTALDVVMVGINGELTTSKAMVLSEMGGFLSHLEREQLGERWQERRCWNSHTLRASLGWLVK